jgi:hypothetical protein
MIFNPFVFLAGIIAGIFIICTMRLKTKEIIRYPNPENVDSTIYRDKNGVCFKFKSNDVSCEDNASAIKEFPISN